MTFTPPPAQGSFAQGWHSMKRPSLRKAAVALAAVAMFATALFAASVTVSEPAEANHGIGNGSILSKSGCSGSVSGAPGDTVTHSFIGNTVCVSPDADGKHCTVTSSHPTASSKFSSVSCTDALLLTVVIKSGATAGTERITLTVRATWASARTGVTIDVTVASLPTSSITFVGPTDLKVGTNRTQTIDALDYVTETHATYTITCDDATTIDNVELDTVVRDNTGNGCTFTINPKTVEGSASFVVPYRSSGGDTHDGTINIEVGPESTITYVGPTDLMVGTNQTQVVDALEYVTESHSGYSISCGNAINIDTTELSTVVRDTTGDGCTFTVSPTSVEGAASFDVPYTSEGGHKTEETINIQVGPDSTITYEAPDLKVGRNQMLVVDASDWVTEAHSGYTISCEDATSLATGKFTSVSRGSGATACEFTIDPEDTLTTLQQGDATFTIPYRSSGGDTESATVTVDIGPDSAINYVAPTLKIGRNRVLVVDASGWVTEDSPSDFTITCGDAENLSAGKFTSINRGTGEDACEFTITPESTLTGNALGAANFDIPYTSDGGATSTETVTVTIGPDSTITYNPPGQFSIGKNRVLVIDASGWVTEADTNNAITCADATGVDNNKLTSVVRGSGATACQYTITPVSALTAQQEGHTDFSLKFTSDGGHEITREIRVHVGPNSNIQFQAPASHPSIAASRSRTIDVGQYARDGDYGISCGTITASNAHISIVSQNGCRVTVRSGTQANQTADLTIPYRSEGGHTKSEMLTLSVGAASSINFNLPTLKVGINRTRKINLLDWASDGGYTVSCGTISNAGANAPTTGTIAGSGATVPSTSVAIGVTPDSTAPCTLTLNPSSQGTAIFSILLTSNGGDSNTYNIAVTVGANSNISFTAPPALRVGKNQTLEIDALDYLTGDNEGTTYTVTCGAATLTHTGRMTVTKTEHPGTSCDFTIEPDDNLATNLLGNTSFTFDYNSEGGHTVTGTITVSIGPDSNLVFADPAPSAFKVGRNRTYVINALDYITGDNQGTDFTVTCADPTVTDSTKMTVTRGTSSSNRCMFTVDPEDTLTTLNQGDTTFSTVVSSTGQATATATFTIDIGPDSTVTYTAPDTTGPNRIFLARNQTLEIDASGYAVETSPTEYTISCGDATNLSSRLNTVARGSGGDACKYTITPHTSASPGPATFRVRFTSAGRHSTVGTITVNIGPTSRIDFSGPPTSSPNWLTVGRNRTLEVDASDYVTEAGGSAYDITCQDASSFHTNRLTSVIRSQSGNGCVFTLTPQETLSTALQATTATFTVPYSSTGGATASGTIHVKIGPDSTITYEAPTGRELGRNLTRVIDASAYVQEVAGSGWTITCLDAENIDTNKLDAVRRGSGANACRFTIDPKNTLTTGQQGQASFDIPYVSTGGHKTSGTVNIRIGPDSDIDFQGPTSPPGIPAGRSRSLDVSGYATDGDYTIWCGGNPTDNSARISITAQSGDHNCILTVAATSGSLATARIRVTYVSSGGDRTTENVDVEVGRPSNIQINAPTNLKVGTNRTQTINVLDFASDTGGYTLTCGTAADTGANAPTTGTVALDSVTKNSDANGCGYTIDPGSTQGTATFTIPLTSDGQTSATATISIEVGPASTITFAGPPSTGSGSGRLRVGRNRAIVVNAAQYATESHSGYAITCGDAKSIDNTRIASVTHSGNSCMFTVQPDSQLASSSYGNGAFTVPYISEGGHTEDGTINVDINADSTITYTPPAVTGANRILIGRNLTYELNAATLVAEVSGSPWAVTCAAATGFDTDRLVVSRADASGAPCVFTINPVDTLAVNLQGQTTFDIPFTSTGGHTTTGRVTVEIGPDSDIQFAAPTGLKVGRNRTLEINALEAITEDTAYTVRCADATGVTATKMSVTRTQTGTGCVFTVNPVGTISGNDLGDTTFDVLFTSTGGDTHTGRFTVTLGPDSTITYTPPQNLKIGRNRTLEINAAPFAVETSPSDFSISCANPRDLTAGKLTRVIQTPNTCTFTVDPNNFTSPGQASFTITYTSTGGHVQDATISLRVGPNSTIRYTAPPTSGSRKLLVGRNLTLAVNALDYVQENNEYTVTCTDITGVDTNRLQVTRTGNSCNLTINPEDLLADNLQGSTFFNIAFTSDGGATATGRMTVTIGPDSDIVYTNPGALKVGRNQMLVIDALEHITEDDDYTVSCANPTVAEATKMTVTRGTGSNRCTFTVDPEDTLVQGSQGPTTFTTVLTSSGQATETATFTIDIGADSTIVFVGPPTTGTTADGRLIVGRNRSLEVNAAPYATDGDYTIGCDTAINLDDKLTSVTRADAANAPCVFTVTPDSAATLGDASFQVPYSSDGRDTEVGTITLRVGPDSTIVFTAPDPELRVGVDRTRQIDALAYVRDGNYGITCGDATAIDTTELSTVIRSDAGNGCSYTITPTAIQGPASFTIPYTSEGGHILNQPVSITVGPASTITVNAPPATGPNSLSVALNRTLEINAGAYASEADPSHTITCNDPTGIHTRIASVARNGCVYTVTPAQTGVATFTVPYTSDGGHTADGEITVTIGAATNIVFTPPLTLRMAASDTLTVNAASYVADGSYTFTCGEATGVGNRITVASPTGCSFELSSGSGTGSASFTVPYTSSGGDTYNGQITVAIGPAPTTSRVVFIPPPSLTVQAGTQFTVDASRYAADPVSGNTITCDEATGIDSDKISSASHTGCSYQVTTTATATGTALITIPYTSSGGAERSGRIRITINPQSDIQYTAPTDLVIGAGNTKTINLQSYAQDSSYTVTCGNATATDTAKLTSITRNGCAYTITAASSAIQGDTTFTLTYTSTGGDTHNATVTITIGEASNIVFDAHAEVLTVGTGSIITVNADTYATDGTYTITCSEATDISTSLLTSITRNGCTYTARTANTPGDATYTIVYTSTGGDTHTATIHIAIIQATSTGGGGSFTFDFGPPPGSQDDEQEPEDETDDETDEEPEETEDDEDETEEPDSTTTPPQTQRPSTTLEADQPGPRWNTLTAQSGGTTTRQLRDNLNISPGTRIYTWNTRTQTWTPAAYNIPAGTRISFRTQQALTDEDMQQANLGAGTTRTTLTPGWNILAIPENIAKIHNRNFAINPTLTDCRNQQGIIAIANYSHRTRQWSIHLPCHPQTQRQLTTGQNPPFKPLTTITQGDTTYIYTNTRTPFTINWDTETQTYQPT